MKTIEKLQAIALKMAPWLIAITIFFGSVMVFPKLSYNYANSKSIIIQLGFSLVILLGLIAIPWQSFKSYAKSKIAWGIGATIVVMILATIFGVDGTISWFGHLERGTGTFFVTITALGAIMSVLLAYHTKTIRKAILYPIAAGSSIIAISTMLGFTGFNIIKAPFLSNISYGGGLTGNSSFAGTYLMMSFFVIAYLFFTTNIRWKKILIAIMGFLSIFNPVIFGYGMLKGNWNGFISIIGDARGAVFSLIIGLVLSAGIYLSFNKKDSIKWIGKTLATGIITITAVVVLLVCIPNNAIHNTFVEKASGTRFLYWNVALTSIKAHPILGTGPETFRYANERYFNSDFMRNTYKRELWADKPHNAYLEMLATQGILGLAAYVFLIGATIWVLVKKAKNEENKYVVAAFSGMLLAYLVNNFILFDVNISFLLFFVLLALLGLEEVKQLIVSNNETDKPVRRYGMIAVGVAIMVIAFATTIPEIVKLKRILVEMYAPLNIRAGSYEISEKASPYGSGVTLAQRADVYTQNYLGHLNEVLASSKDSQVLVMKDVDSLARALEISFDKYPVSAQGAIAYGRLGSVKIALLNALDEKSLKMMIDGGNLAIKLSPTNPQGYWILGQAYAYEGKFDEAKAVFKQALAINPKIPESYTALMELAKLAGDQKSFEEAVKGLQTNVSKEDLVPNQQ